MVVDDSSDAGAEELRETSQLWRAKRDLDSAIAGLASRPLDEATAAEMRRVLDSEELAAARALWVRGRVGPVLRLVEGGDA